MTLKNIRILDLDNCVSDDAHRIPLIDWNIADLNERYARYHALSCFDWCRNEHLFLETRQTIVVFTGRPDSERFRTMEWLRRHKVRVELALFRPNDSRLRSVDLKEKMLEMLLEQVPLDEIRSAFDDRADICDMYRRRGIPDVQQVCIHNVDAYLDPRTGRDVDEQPREA